MQRTNVWAAVLVGVIVGLIPSLSTFAGSRAEQINVEQQPQEKLVFITGSQIPQRIKVKYIGTEVAWNVKVIGQHEIDISGRRSVADVLRSEGIGVSHGR
jgi:hypothetical protein